MQRGVYKDHTFHRLFGPSIIGLFLGHPPGAVVSLSDSHSGLACQPKMRELNERFESVGQQYKAESPDSYCERNFPACLPRSLSDSGNWNTRWLAYSERTAPTEPEAFGYDGGKSSS